MILFPKFLDNLCATFYLFHQHSSKPFRFRLKRLDLKSKFKHSEISCFPQHLCVCLTSGLICPSVSLCALGSHTTASSSSRTSDLTSGAITEVAENYRRKNRAGRKKKKKALTNLPGILGTNGPSLSEHYRRFNLRHFSNNFRARNKRLQRIRVSLTYLGGKHAKSLSSLCILLRVYRSDVAGSRKFRFLFIFLFFSCGLRLQ